MRLIFALGRILRIRKRIAEHLDVVLLGLLHFGDTDDGIRAFRSQTRTQQAVEVRIGVECAIEWTLSSLLGGSVSIAGDFLDFLY